MNPVVTRGRILAAVAVTLLFLGGCATMPPVESRISRRPDLFESLSESQQELVLQGRVKEGMPKDAVYLAWGEANEIRQSSRNGKSLETWIYLGTEAIPHRRIGFDYGFGYGYCDGYGYGGPVYEIDYEYRSYVIGRVEFDRGKVVYWEWNRRQW